MIKVNFSDVGRNKKSWTASCPTEISFEWLYKQVKTFGGLMSNDIAFTNEHGKGTIFAGVRSVGTFEIVTETITNQGGGQ